MRLGSLKKATALAPRTGDLATRPRHAARSIIRFVIGDVIAHECYYGPCTARIDHLKERASWLWRAVVYGSAPSAGLRCVCDAGGLQA